MQERRRKRYTGLYLHKSNQLEDYSHIKVTLQYLNTSIKVLYRKNRKRVVFLQKQNTSRYAVDCLFTSEAPPT